MKNIDCYWELANIGKRTTEITCEKQDAFDKTLIASLVEGYDYAVVKVPAAMTSFNIGLSEMGFACIEAQMNISKTYADFDFGLTAGVYDDTQYLPVMTDRELNEVLDRITPGMFSTDRISLDPQFGIGVACTRYRNWIRTDYISGRSQLFQVIHKGDYVGFMLIKREGDEIDLLLNGLYSPYQGKGLGILTPASPLLYARKSEIAVGRVRTSISSNNIPVVKLYNRLHFMLDSLTYVFVKHQEYV